MAGASVAIALAKALPTLGLVDHGAWHGHDRLDLRELRQMAGLVDYCLTSPPATTSTALDVPLANGWCDFRCPVLAIEAVSPADVFEPAFGGVCGSRSSSSSSRAADLSCEAGCQAHFVVHGHFSSVQAETMHD